MVLACQLGLNHDSAAQVHYLHFFLDRKWFLTVSNENTLQKAPNSVHNFFSSKLFRCWEWLYLILMYAKKGTNRSRISLSDPLDRTLPTYRAFLQVFKVCWDKQPPPVHSQDSQISSPLHCNTANISSPSLWCHLRLSPAWAVWLPGAVLHTCWAFWQGLDPLLRAGTLSLPGQPAVLAGIMHCFMF